MAVASGPRRRSTLPREEARRRYVEIGRARGARAGARRRSPASTRRRSPSARSPASTPAPSQRSKGRPAVRVTNVFGSQSAFQAETMALALSAWEFVERIEYPDPAAFATADEWVDAFFAGESARGPAHGADARGDVRVALGALAERRAVRPVERAGERAEPRRAAPASPAPRGGARGALARFGLELREGTTLRDLASAIASLVEGVWLNQCLTRRHPSDPSEPIATLLRRSGRLLWLGATLPG